MLMFIIRGVFLIGVLSWYSATVWKVIDGYFQDQFRAYLQEEYRKHPQIKADVERAGAVDKGSVPSRALPAEPSLSRGVAETYDSNTACPADIADACSRAIVSSGKPEEAVAGGTSEIAVAAAAAVGAGTTDKNAFPSNAARLAQESRKPPLSSSDSRDKERRPGAINPDGEEDAIEGNVLSAPASSRRRRRRRCRRAEKPRRRCLDKRELPRVSKEISRDISREKSRHRRMNTLVLKDVNFAAVKMTGDDEDDDFSEFEEDEKDRRVRKDEILVSELPFKPKADIGNLDRVTTEEFCPLTLEDEATCGETTAWP